jgi:hypothetical protein
LPPATFQFLCRSLGSHGSPFPSNQRIIGNTASVTLTIQRSIRNGFYEVNGFKFSQYYYERLWSHGRPAPSLIAKMILEGTSGQGVPDPEKPGFFRYEVDGWEMVYNPVTNEVWHLQPM